VLNYLGTEDRIEASVRKGDTSTGQHVPELYGRKRALIPLHHRGGDVDSPGSITDLREDSSKHGITASIIQEI
jgi:hypothetical protein